MIKIKEIISALKDSTIIEKEYTLDEVYEMCCKDITNIEKNLADYSTNTDSMCAELFLNIETKMKEVQVKIFRKCCEIKGIQESQSAFCLYRDFLIEYNKTMQTYNVSIRGTFNGYIKRLTDEILETKEKLLPINNDNIDVHVRHHEINEPLMRKIEQLENERRELLRNML